jgi:hypothetical protein
MTTAFRALLLFGVLLNTLWIIGLGLLSFDLLWGGLTP